MIEYNLRNLEVEVGRELTGQLLRSNASFYNQSVPLVKIKGRRHMYDLWAVKRDNEADRLMIEQNMNEEEIMRRIPCARILYPPHIYKLVRKPHHPEVVCEDKT